MLLTAVVVLSRQQLLLLLLAHLWALVLLSLRLFPLVLHRTDLLGRIMTAHLLKGRIGILLRHLLLRSIVSLHSQHHHLVAVVLRRVLASRLLEVLGSYVPVKSECASEVSIHR